MIAASDDLLALLDGESYGRADLYTLSPVGLDVLTFTSADLDIVLEGVTYGHGKLRASRDRLRSVAGLETDTFTLTLTVETAAETAINGVPFRQAAQWGLLDGAGMRLDWAYLSDWGPPPTVVGRLLRFDGAVSDIAIDRAGVKLSCKSKLALLDTQVPRQVYQAHCRFMLGDSHCGVDVEAYKAKARVTADGTTTRFATSLTDQAAAWALGWVSFTSGLNKGVTRGVRALDADGSLTLSGPLPWSPMAGDGFDIYPGCDKTMPSLTSDSGTASCAAKFCNAARFGGMPFIPTPETAT